MLTVREDPNVSILVEQAKLQWDRADDVWEAITWVVAHDPEVGRPVTESGKTRSLTLEGARSANLPTITIVYEIENPYVTIHDVSFREPSAPHAGQA